MANVIVTTTINAPTPAIRKFDAMPDWNLIVVGDKKTPEYRLDRGRFIPWQEVESLYPELCKLIGFNCTQLGRMVAFLEAAKEKPDLVATIDDDCDPDNTWPGQTWISKRIECDCYHCDAEAFDPFVIAGYEHPARGYPPQLGKEDYPSGVRSIAPLVQENFWDGEADYDACWRIHGSKYEFCDRGAPFWSNAFSPINTQNTIISGSVLKDHCGELPFVGHVSDIWAGYLFQAWHPNSTLYCPANVEHWQERTLESVLKDLEEEIYSYRHTLNFLRGLVDYGPDGLSRIPCVPAKTIEAIEIYRSYFQ